MPSPRYTKIEITPEAYLALEAESILQGKTLKKLASEMILKGVSDKSLQFIQAVTKYSSEEEEMVAKAIDKVGPAEVSIDEALSTNIQALLRREGYVSAMLFVAQHTASIKRDELHRVLSICDQYKLPPELAAEVIKKLNNIDQGGSA